MGSQCALERLGALSSWDAAALAKRVGVADEERGAAGAAMLAANMDIPMRRAARLW